MARVVRDALRSSFAHAYINPEPEPEPEEPPPPPPPPPEPEPEQPKEALNRSGRKSSWKGVSVKDLVKAAAEVEVPVVVETVKDPWLPRLVAIDAQFKNDVAASKVVEQYLTAAQIAAREADEAALLEADHLYTVNHRKTGLPKGPNPLFLEPTQISGLLDPAAIIASNAVRTDAARAAPRTMDFMDVGVKNYLRPNANTTARHTMLARSASAKKTHGALRMSARLAGEPEPEMSAEQLEKAAANAQRLRDNYNQLSIEQKLSEEAALRVMREKLAFLKNPRHSAPPVATFQNAFGRTLPVSTRDRPAKLPAVPAKSNLAADPSQYFSIEPPQVFFQEYEAGAVYEIGLTLRNLSAISRRVRVLPPASRYFSITQPRFPSADGLLAPGMPCQMLVRFVPDSLANYEDGITVVTELDRFRVPLVAKRPPPSLTLKHSLDCGYVLVGNTSKASFTFRNVGGAGRFRLCADADWPQGITEPSAAGTIPLGPFTLGPAELFVGAGGTGVLHATFAPEAVGESMQLFHMICDNCQVKRFTLAAQGVNLTVFPATLDARPLLPGELARPVLFGSTIPGSSITRTFLIKNSTPVPVPFKWLTRTAAAVAAAADAAEAAEAAAEEARGAEGSVAVTFDGGDGPDGHERADQDGGWVESSPPEWLVEPFCGTMAPRSEVSVSVTYAPSETGHATLAAKFVVDSALPEAEERCWGDCVAVEFEAVGGDALVELAPALLSFAGALLPGIPVHRDVTLTNASETPATFHWEGAGSVLAAGGIIAIEPEGGVLGPLATATCRVTVEAAAVGALSSTLVCVVEHGARLLLQLNGEVDGPRVTVLQPSLDFGLLQVACLATQSVSLRNETDVPLNWRASDSSGVLVLGAVQGHLEPWEGCSIDVSLTPAAPCAFAAVLTFNAGGPPARLEVRAQVLAPAAALDTARVDLGDTFLTVAVERTLRLKNLTQLPATFSWGSQVLGAKNSMALGVEVMPREGTLAPGSQLDCVCRFLPRELGVVKGIVACDLAGAAAPIGFALSTEVKGLRVEYTVRRADGSVVTGGPEGGVTGDTVLDFGRWCELGKRCLLELEVTNLTSIPCDVEASLGRFGGGFYEISPETRFEQTVEATLSGASRERQDGAAGRALGIESLRRGGKLPEGHLTIGGTSAAARSRGGARGGTALHSAGGTVGTAGTLGTGSLGGVGRSSQTAPTGTRSMPGKAGTLSRVVSHGGTAFTAKTAVDAAPIRLPAAGAETNFAFVRQGGATMVAAKRLAAEEAAALANGRGLAVDLTTTGWTLPAFGTWRCALTAHCNAPGEYDDNLVVALHAPGSDLPPRSFPLRVGVVGSPLELHLERRRLLGVPGANHSHARSLPTIQWGALPVGNRPVSKTFCATNVSPFPVFVAWAPEAFVPEEAEQLVSVGVRESGDSRRPAVLAVAPASCAVSRSPYVVDPETAVIGPGATAQFSVSFQPDAEGVQDGVLVGRQRFASDDFAENGLKLLLWDALGRWGYADREAAPLSATIRGGFHPFAGAPAVPMPPARLGLVARALAPHFEVEGRRKAVFHVATTTADPDTAPSFRRSLTLTNACGMPASVQISATPPFSLLAVEPSVPQLPASGPLTARVYTLPPRETAEVTLAFQLPPSEDPSLRDYSLHGSLVFSFTTGVEQRFPLVAQVEHPEVCISSVAADFGRTHCGAPRVVVLELSNPTQIDAEWAAVQPGSEDPAADSFCFSPQRGFIPGRGTGNPKTVAIEVVFQPGAAVRYSTDLAIAVRSGRGCSLLVSGEGTFDETAEDAVHLRGVQSPRRRILEAAMAAGARLAAEASGLTSQSSLLSGVSSGTGSGH